MNITYTYTPFEFPYDRFTSEVSEEMNNYPKYSKVDRVDELKDKIYYQKKYLIKKRVIKTGINPTCFTMAINNFSNCYVEMYNDSGKIIGYNEEDLINGIVGIPVFLLLENILYIQRNYIKLIFPEINLKDLVEYRSIISSTSRDNTYYLSWLFQNKTAEMIKIENSFTNYFDQAFVALNFKRPLEYPEIVMSKGKFILWINSELAISFTNEGRFLNTWTYWPELKLDNPKRKWSCIERWNEPCTIVQFIPEIYKSLKELQTKGLISDCLDNPISTFKELIEKLVSGKFPSGYRRRFEEKLGTRNHYVQLFLNRLNNDNK